MGLLTRPSHNQLQQERGIRVKVFSGDLDKALTIWQRKMQSSGMERLIKAQPTHHIKNSENKLLARKNLERKIKSIDFARKLQSILIKKVRNLKRGQRSGSCWMLVSIPRSGYSLFSTETE